MRRVRGYLYHLVTGSTFAWLVGTFFRKRPFDRNGSVSVPDTVSPYMVSGIIFGAYEYSERYLIRKWLPANLDAVELGASIGVVSREILNRIDSSKRLISAEALPALAKLARVNIGTRHPRAKWQVLDTAIAYGVEKITFIPGREHVAGRIGTGLVDVEPDLQTVPATTLSGILARHKLADFSLIVDIEGAEHDLILHDKAALKNCRCIIAELHGESDAKDGFCEALNDLGMVLVERKHSVVAFLKP